MICPMVAHIEAPDRDVRMDIANLLRLDSLWQTPNRDAVPLGWRLPEGVYIGVASQNERKIAVVRDVVQQLGGYDVDAKPSSEELIKRFLEIKDIGWNLMKKNLSPYVTEEKNAWYTIQMVAARKPMSAFQRDRMVTHALGMDTDIVVVDQKDRHQMGIPQNEQEFKDMLLRLSGKTVRAQTTIAIVNFSDDKDVVFGDTMAIQTTFKKFTPQQMIAAIGTKGIGRFTGGIDLSDFRMSPFLDERVPIKAFRTGELLPDELEDSHPYVLFETTDAAPVLYEYITGAPREMLRWVIYNGVVKAATSRRLEKT